MHDRHVIGCLSILAAGCLLLGCAQTGYQDFQAVGYLGKPPLKYYKDVATSIDYPHVHSDTVDMAAATDEPRRVRSRRQDEVWDMTLPEAIQIALMNNEIIRTRGQFLSPGNPLLTNPDFQPSIYDVGIQETGILFGQRGVEAALADFDTQFTTTMLFGKDERFLNQAVFAPEDQILVEDTVNFNTQLAKTMATGGRFAVSHIWNYARNNSPNRLFESAYEGFVRAEYRQPLWAGAGVEFTRIAGPITQNIEGISGVNQGVLISRINADITLADFEANVRNMVRDVEDAYWDLFLAYHIWDAEVVARNSALRIWQLVKARPGTGAADEAQARDNYFETKTRAAEALSRVYATENQLRNILSLPVNDGKVIRPSEEPVTAEFQPDWHMSLAEALTDRVELRRQKWNIKSLELQLQAANNMRNPRLDFVSSYQVNAAGDQLFGSRDFDGVTQQGFRSAYETLTQGNQTGWNLGFEFSVPLGLRTTHSQVRHIELRLAKARAALAAQEMEISHELANSIQNLDLFYETAKSNFNRRVAAEDRLRAYEALYEADVAPGTAEAMLDLVLRSQLSLAQADIAYHTSLAEYNRAIADLHFRKGTLLHHNSVHLMESLWEPEAYVQALQKAWHRSHAIKSKFRHTEPYEFVLGSAAAIEYVVPEGDAFPPAVPDADSLHLPPAPFPTPLPESVPNGDSFEGNQARLESPSLDAGYFDTVQPISGHAGYAPHSEEPTERRSFQSDRPIRSPLEDHGQDAPVSTRRLPPLP
jgi:outer membrane protein TolC